MNELFKFANVLSQDIILPELPDGSPWIAVVIMSIIGVVIVVAPILSAFVIAYSRYRNKKLDMKYEEQKVKLDKEREEMKKESEENRRRSEEAKLQAEEAVAQARSLEVVTKALNASIEDRRANTKAVEKLVESQNELTRAITSQVQSTKDLRTTLMDQDERLGLVVKEMLKGVEHLTEGIDKSITELGSKVLYIQNSQKKMPPYILENVRRIIHEVVNEGPDGITMVMSALKEFETTLIEEIRQSKEKASLE